MQLGARWRVGDAPHRGVPPALHAAIAEAEAAHPGAAAWTLTWLEGRPRCALDEVLVLSLDPRGGAVVEPAAGVAGDFTGAADDDDDDWLSEGPR